VVESGSESLVDHVLDGGFVDHRDHLFRDGLRGGEETGA
jgi:hypothetical protein